MSYPAPTTARRTRRPHEFVLLRLLPHDSPVHRLWAGTKLLVVLGLGVMLSFRPTWPALGAAAAVVAVGIVAARVPAGAVPRLPRWVWVLALADALLTLRSGTPPLVYIGSVDLSLGGRARVGWRRRLGTAVRDVEGLLSTAVVVALRRARDLADAIDARGGLAAPGTPSATPGTTDVAVLVGVAAVIAAVLVL